VTSPWITTIGTDVVAGDSHSMRPTVKFFLFESDTWQCACAGADAWALLLLLLLLLLLVVLLLLLLLLLLFSSRDNT
jgi:hypothetical protein